ncbi:hypothetical protein C8F04DRAFT_947971 [Mycena alexandri]|uniref:Uncharacterized protein n=1 Tax=Mycena alexandri TaxID=1745969 RepID=A0AAD6T7L7_9AGAR|nr:hypothetical protein C8F04DRAFT_947971 [Mycena alexandri]
MFKSAATKIAHNSTLPSLALSGNKDLRPLQDLITAEKVVLMSLQKLSVDFTKASEALRVWGAGEGEDLGVRATFAEFYGIPWLWDADYYWMHRISWAPLRRFSRISLRRYRGMRRGNTAFEM